VSSAHFLVSAGVYVFFPSFLKAFWAAWAAACGAVRDHARAGIEDFPRPSHRVPGALRFPKDHRPGTRTCSSSCAPKGRKGTRTIERRSLLPTMLLRSNMHDVIYLAVQVMGTIVAPPASTWRGGRNDHWLMFNRVNGLTAGACLTVTDRAGGPGDASASATIDLVSPLTTVPVTIRFYYMLLHQIRRKENLDTSEPKFVHSSPLCAN
jgi:hypothetical protein